MSALKSNTSKFQNSFFDIKLEGILKSDNDVNLITKNVPFSILVKQKSNNKNNNVLKNITKDKISLKLVYENDLENNVNILKTSPLEYNIYIKDNNNEFIVTVETRIHILSSKHENNLFRIILDFDNGKSLLYTEPIKCVSKITNTVMNKDYNKDQFKEESNVKVESTTTTSSPVVKKSKPILRNNNSNSNSTSIQLIKTINKLKKLRKNDKNLITLLYQQNKLITNQLNSVTSIVNSLVVHHNNNNNKNNSNSNNNNVDSNNSNNNNVLVYNSSPSHEAPYSPNSFSLPPSSPTDSSSVPFSYDDNNNKQQVQQRQDFQFPTVDAEMLKSMTSNTEYNFQSDDFQQQQQQNKVASANTTSSASSINEVRFVDNQLNFKTSGIIQQQAQQAQQILENTYSHLSTSNFSYDLDFNLLTSQNLNSISW